ncbi:MAG: hypothetical protein FWG87_12500 [Defluviitaleaceae bacterium]|nr:hypothetical protein [Defluviitaleaceae bacterium]
MPKLTCFHYTQKSEKINHHFKFLPAILGEMIRRGFARILKAVKHGFMRIYADLADSFVRIRVIRVNPRSMPFLYLYSG